MRFILFTKISKDKIDLSEFDLMLFDLNLQVMDRIMKTM